MVEGGFECALLAQEVERAGKLVLRLGATGGAAADWFGLMGEGGLLKPPCVATWDWTYLQNKNQFDGTEKAVSQILGATLNAVSAITGAPQLPNKSLNIPDLHGTSTKSHLYADILGPTYQAHVVNPPFQLSLKTSTKANNPWTQLSSDEWAALATFDRTLKATSTNNSLPNKPQLPVSRPSPSRKQSGRRRTIASSC